jgi:hypothetical protein
MRDETLLARAFDAVFGFLARPRVRRVRRWSFLVTLPLGLLGASALGAGLSLGNGLKAGIAAALLDAALLLFVLVLGARVLGRECRDALLDFLMHPTARRAMVAEARTLLVLPRALWRRLRPPEGREFTYERGSHEVGFALAILPAIVAEGAAVHLVLHAAPTWVRLAVAALHAYGLLMLLGLALGPSLHPHRLTERGLQLHAGHLTRVEIPLEDVATIRSERRRVRGRSGLVVEDGEALFLRDGRADLRVELREPVLVERALRDPVAVQALVVAVDDPEGLAAAVGEAQGRPALVRSEPPRVLAWLTPAELLDAATA